MLARVIADLTFVVHLLTIVMIVVGAVGWLRFRWWPYLHLPFALWGVLISLVGWTCPLTPIENHFRQSAGQQGYAGGFIEHYIMPVIYPGAITPVVQYTLGAIVLFCNLAIYLGIWWRKYRIGSY